MKVYSENVKTSFHGCLFEGYKDIKHKKNLIITFGLGCKVL